MALLETKDLTSGYGELQILWGVDLTLEQGILTSMVGSNGVGKTTLLRTVMGLIKPWKGQVLFDGRDVTRLSAHEKASLGLVLVPEGRQLFTDMTVRENLELGANPRRARQKAAENLERVFDLFPRLKERERQKAGTLSGGEQQMVAVARGIMAEPALLMIDELSLGLSPLLTFSLFRALRLLANQGYTILLVEQNVHLALKVSDYAYILNEGKVELSGPAAEIQGNDKVRAAYLGI
ncbi:MAG: ABC transporter ATP-binding protein [Actinobacteria bacterium]|nr:ABC transporter ATP-binding protein [Actinomycetota bacterium]